MITSLEELRNLIDLIERIHAEPSKEFTEGPDDSEIENCCGYTEGLECCIDRIRNSDEFRAVKAILE